MVIVRGDVKLYVGVGVDVTVIGYCTGDSRKGKGKGKDEGQGKEWTVKRKRSFSEEIN